MKLYYLLSSKSITILRKINNILAQSTYFDSFIYFSYNKTIGVVNMNYIVIAHIICILIVGVITFLVYNEKFSENQKYLGLVSVSAFICVIGCFLGDLASSEGALIVAVKIQYFGVAYLYTFLLLLIMRSCNANVNTWVAAVLIIFDTIMLTGALLMDYHDLFFEEFYAKKVGDFFQTTNLIYK